MSNDLNGLVDKKNQHYVWQKYLQSWTDGKLLHCLRNGKINTRTTKNVAAEKYFYKTEELTPAEINFIDEFAISKSPAELQENHRNWLKIHNQPFEALNKAKEKFTEDELKIRKKYLENNLYEEIHFKSEEAGEPYINALVKKDISFFKEQKGRLNFLCFLAAQCLRTEKTRSAVFDAAAKAALTAKRNFGVDLEKIRNPLINIFVDNLAFNMEKDDLKIILFDNQSDLHFITGDQPVVNTYAINVPPGEQVKKLEFYFPVSPNLAVLVTDNQLYRSSAVIPINSEVVAYYNHHIFVNSKNEVYGFTKESLEKAQQYHIDQRVTASQHKESST